MTEQEKISLKPKEGTYFMEYTCSNCGNIYLESIPKGFGAKGCGGKCPYCGVSDHGGFYYAKPK